MYVCAYSCESTVNSSDAFPEHPNMKRTRPTAKQPLGRNCLGSAGDGSDSLQPCSLDSTSPLPPPCTSGVGRKRPGEQNILPAPPCSSQAFLGSLRTGLPTSWQPRKSQLWALEEGLSAQLFPGPIQDDDPKSRASSIFCKSLAMGQSWERKGREVARCAATSSFYPPPYLYPVSVSPPPAAWKNLWASACLLNEILRAAHMISDTLL